MLTVRAHAKLRLDLRPNRLYLGEIVEGQVVEQSLELIGEEAAGVKLLSADGGEKFEVEVLEEKGALGKRMVKLSIAPKPPLQEGPIRGRIEIETSHPKKKRLQLGVTARATRRVVTPP